MEFPNPYIQELKERSKRSHAHTKHQLLGLEVAQILQDEKHKSLYIKLAKEGDPSELKRLAQEVQERRGIKNKGAYFMKLWKIRRNDIRNTKNRR